MPNYLLRLSFVGTDFHGWQYQPGVRTVQGELSKALGRLFNEKVMPVGCCRTDAGVHALDYVANFKARRAFPEDKLLKALNGLLPKDLGVSEVEEVSESFNARYDAKGKVYLYKLWTAPYRDPFLYPFVWQVRKPDLRLLERLSKELEGERDFSPFAKLEGGERTVLKLEEVSVRVSGYLVELRFKGRSFLRYMVRRMVGLLVKTAQGLYGEEFFYQVLEGREKAPYTAPAKGLHLEKVLL